MFTSALFLGRTSLCHALKVDEMQPVQLRDAQSGNDHRLCASWLVFVHAES